MSSSDRSAAARPGPSSVRALFLTFNRIALSGFGGVLPWAQRVLVEEKGWLTAHEFVELLSLGQVLPGPNVCNLSLMLGQRYFGWRGAAAALGGLMIAPIAIVLAIAVLYARYAEVPAVQRAVAATSAVAAGLVLAMGIKMLRATRKRAWAWVLLAAAFAAVGLMHWPLVGVLAVLGPLAMLMAWVGERP